MAGPWYRLEDEEQMLREIADYSNRQASYRTTAIPDQADVIAEMNAAFPNLDPSLLTAASLAVTTGVLDMDGGIKMLQQSQDYMLQQAELATMNRGVGGGAGGGGGNAEDDLGFGGRLRQSAYGGLKGSARLFFAGAQAVEQIGTNQFARLPYELGTLLGKTGDTDVPFYNVSPREGEEVVAYRPTASWWDPKAYAETFDIYQLLSGKETGEGFFVSDEAREAQQAAAIRYRGGLEVPDATTKSGTNIVGMTGGRLAALHVAQPGSEMYNNVSGLADAAWAMSAPTGFTTAGRAVRQTQRGVSSVTRGSLRNTFGLTNGMTPYIQSERVAGWLASGDGQRLARNVASVQNVSDARRLLPNASARTWDELVKTTNETEATQVLSRVLGAERGAMSVNEMNWSNWNQIKSNVLRNPVSRYMGVERAVTRAPGRSLTVGFADDGQITRTVRDAEDWLKLIYTKPAERNAVVNDLTDALLNNKGNAKNVVDRVNTIFADAMERRGIPREVSDALFTRHIDEGAEVNVFNVLDDYGAPTIYDAAARQYLFEDEAGNLVPGFFSKRSVNRGWLDSEHHRWTIQLPDPRAVQRLTKPVNWMFNRRGVNKMGQEITNPELPVQFINDAGSPMWPVAGMDWLHNKLFKKSALGSGGYGFRIALEGLFAQSFSPGIRSGVFHPLELISALLFRRKNVGKYKGTVTGERWDDALGTFLNPSDPQKIVDESLRDAIDFIEGGLIREVQPGVLEKATWKANSWSEVTRNNPQYINSVADNIHLLANDRISRLIAEGKTPQQIVEMAKAGDKNVLAALRDFEARKASEGFNAAATGAPHEGSFKIFRSNGTIIDTNAVNIINDFHVPRFLKFTGSDPRLISIVKNGLDFGKFTPAGATGEVMAFQKTVDGMFGPEPVAAYSDEFLATIREVNEANPTQFPDIVKGRVNKVSTNVTSDMSESQRALYTRWNGFVQRLFADVLTRPDKVLNRSVMWRKFYYEGIDLLLPQLDAGEAQRILEFISEAAQKDGVKLTDRWAGNYIGSQDTWLRIKSMADGSTPATGSRTVEEVSALARMFAADQARKVLYDATEKSNFAVALSVLSPFVSAWKDGVTRWPRLLLSQPNETQRVFQTFEGLANADPDNDGKGYFYRNSNGEWVYNYPTGLLGEEGTSAFLGAGLLGTIGAAAFGVPGLLAGAGLGGAGGYVTAQAAQESGLSFPMTGQLRTANVALSASPGAGPVLQILASTLLRNRFGKTIPVAEDIARALTPYGTPGFEAFLIPSWAQKLGDVIANDPNSTNYYSDAKIQAFDALNTTGRYTSPTGDPEEQAQLNADRNDDASQIATHMVLLRALGQFILPMRPNIEVTVPTQFEGQITYEDVTTMVNDGEVSNIVLAHAYRLLREEDMATADARFLQLFGGPEYIGYMIGKTYTKIPGVQPTDAFEQWETENAELVKNAPNVYAYFAGDVGGEFSFPAWRQQMETGQRVRWDDPVERQQAAEYAVGSRLYQQKLADMGYSPNPLQEETLKAYKKQLYTWFPGYQFAPFDIKEQPRTIAQLEEASLLPEAKATESGTAMRSYFTLRNQVLEVVDQRAKAGGASTLSAGANGDLRAALMLHGIGLVQQYPSFQMVWDDVLFRELDVR